MKIDITFLFLLENQFDFIFMISNMINIITLKK